MALYQAGKTATKLTGYFLPKGSKHPVRGTLHLLSEEKAVVRTIVKDMFVDFGPGTLEPVFISPSAGTGAASRTDWGGSVNRLNLTRLGGIFPAVTLGEKFTGVFHGREDIVENFYNVRMASAQQKARVDQALRLLGWE